MHSRPWQVVSLVGGLVAALTGAFCLAVGELKASGLLFVLAGVALAAGLFTRRGDSPPLRRTRYQGSCLGAPGVDRQQCRHRRLDG